MSEDVAIVGGRVVTGLGDEHQEGTVLVSGGRIAAVGIGIPVPENARVIDATGCWVLPGLIDPHSHIGAHEEANGPAGFDGSEVSSPVTAGVRAIDAINIEDSAFADAVAGGVTAVVVKPGSGNPIGGQSVAIKTGGGRSVDEQVIRHALGMKSALGENPKQTYGERKQLPSTRLGIALVIRQALTDARDYAQRRDRARAEGAPFAADLGMQALTEALDGTLTWEQHAHRHDDIATALRIAEEFGLRLVINHGTEAHKLADVLAERDVPVIFGPVLSSRSKVEVREADPANLAKLAAAGVRVALTTDHPVVPIGLLALQAAVAARAGLPRDRAVAAMTSVAADIAGIGDRVGALEPGRDGDVVLWTGDPLEVASTVREVLIEGRTVYTAPEARG